MKVCVVFGDGLDSGSYIREWEADVMTWMGAGKTPVGPLGSDVKTILYLNPEKVAAVLVERTTRDEEGE